MTSDTANVSASMRRPGNPTHFGGEGLYGAMDSSDTSAHSHAVESQGEQPLGREWLEFIKRNAASLAVVGGLVGLTVLMRQRAAGRPGS